jgi:hypothetical protein
MRRVAFACGVALTLALAAGTIAAAQTPAETPACTNCVEARFWGVSPTFWNSTTAGETPERGRLVQLRKFDVGIAFSGGGTRSASATLGQLRGLEQNGWLARVCYMTAVSGGSWAAVPYTYSRNIPLTELLGDTKPLDPKTIETVPSGTWPRPELTMRVATWDDASAVDMSTSGKPLGDFFTMDAADRPFLIVGGTLVKPNGLDYPRLIPVEYTPLYTGVRQQFGQIGGTYVSPWAYDRLTIAPRSSTHVLVGPKPTERPFTLADVIASSGAAPQLTLMLGDKVPERFRPALQQASEAGQGPAALSVLRDVRREPDECHQAEAVAGESAGRSSGVVD